MLAVDRDQPGSGRQQIDEKVEQVRRLPWAEIVRE